MLIASRRLRSFIATAGAAAAVAAIASGGCSNSATPTNAPRPSPSPTATVTPTTGPTASPTIAPLVFIGLAYASAAPTIDPTYGQVDGFSGLAAAPTASSKPGPSQILNVPSGQPVQFYNFDRLAHTASLLAAANGANWPATFSNANGASAASPDGTAITMPQFSTGTIAASSGVPTASRVYNTGAPGMYYFGDFYFYQATPPMRTVIIVQ
ncbi:MAG: hypothetical protein GIW99_08445 [Candidatus Eremiobacteraeota bacterium]|nr:hypothetical protein [Candidatus Eremiobacteraeota bacterium]MBC5827693.1 hypothetical protein [Candidatus Eremiobacteraeota bacterium]